MLDGMELAETLRSYSERGGDYVRTLQQIIRVNKLTQAEHAYLKNMEPIWLVPTHRRPEGNGE